MLLGFVAAWNVLFAWVRPATASDRTDLVAVVVQAVGGLLLLFGLLFTWRTVRISQDTLRIAQDTLRLSKEGQLAEQFARAVELLGAVDDAGGSRMQTRVGAIYALDRIGSGSAEYKAQVADVLRGYLLAKGVPSTRPEPDGLASVPRWAPGDVPTTRVAPDAQAVLDALHRLSRASGTPGGIDLSRVDLRGARLNGSRLDRADLTEAWLDDASLRDARLDHAVFARAFVTRADLSGAVFEGSRMGGIDLSGSLAIRASFRDADLGHFSLHWDAPIGPSQPPSNLSNCDFGGSDFTAACLAGADIGFSSFRGATMAGADLAGAHGHRVNFREANLAGANLSKARIVDSGFFRTDMRNALLYDAEINGVLKEADLTGAKLQGADLGGCNLLGTILEGADLRGASLLSTYGLTAEQTASAITDGATRLPDGLLPERQADGPTEPAKP